MLGRERHNARLSWTLTQRFYVMQDKPYLNESFRHRKRLWSLELFYVRNLLLSHSLALSGVNLIQDHLAGFYLFTSPLDRSGVWIIAGLPDWLRQPSIFLPLFALLADCHVNSSVFWFLRGKTPFLWKRSLGKRQVNCECHHRTFKGKLHQFSNRPAQWIMIGRHCLRLLPSSKV